MRAVAEDLADQAGEDGAGAGLDEDPGARLIHRLDLRDEADRGADLRGEFGPDGVGVVAVGGRRAVGPHGELGREERALGEGLCEALAGSCHQWAVEGAGYGDALGTETGFAQEAYGSGDRLRRARNHRLTRRVVIGDDDGVGCVGRLQGLFDVLGACRHRGHGSRVVRAGGFEDRRRAFGAQLQQRFRRDRTGRAQGDQLAVAVPGSHVGPDARLGEQGVGGQPGDAQGGLRDPGVRESGLLAVSGGVVEGGRRVERVGVGAAEVQVVLQFGERDEDVGEHAGALTALAGEEEGDLAGIRAGIGEVNTGSQVLLTVQRLPQLPDQLLRIPCHDGHLDRFEPGVRPP